MEDLVAYLKKQVDRQGDETLYSFLDSSGETIDSYTYRRFHERSNYVAARLAETGAVRFGQPVLVAYEPGLEVLVAFLACLKLGALPVPVCAPRRDGFQGQHEEALARGGRRRRHGGSCRKTLLRSDGQPEWQRSRFLAFRWPIYGVSQVAQDG